MENMSQLEDDEIIVRRKKAPPQKKPVSREAILKAISVTLGAMRTKQHPRVELFTSAAAAPLSAAAALAIGSSTIIAEETGEASQLADMAESLAVMLEGVTKTRAEAIRAAVSHAVASSKPWAFLPQINEPLMMRTYLAKELVRRLPGIVVAGEGEIIALAGGDAPQGAMDAAQFSAAADKAAFALVQEMHTAVIVMKPGAVRVMAEDRPVLTIKNSAALQQRIAGWDAAVATVGAAFLGLLRNHKFAAAACAALTCLVAAEIAAEKASAPGSFATAFIDALYAVTDEDIANRMKISIKEV